MSTISRADCRRPPPCAEDCWEWLGRSRGGELVWRYTTSAHRCGHTWDQYAGRWTWSTDTPGRGNTEAVANNPPPPSTTEAPAVTVATDAAPVHTDEDAPF